MLQKSVRFEPMWGFEYVWPIRGGTVRSCGLVGGSVSLWGGL
uniref:Uncharacterized protein n=1 Tax=Trichinella nativa TaxID=6335 RepID=A0A0V1KGN3_9BILA